MKNILAPTVSGQKTAATKSTWKILTACDTFTNLYSVLLRDMQANNLNILTRQKKKKSQQHYDQCHFPFYVKTRTSRTYLRLNLGCNTSLRRKYSEGFVPHHSVYFSFSKLR